MFKANITTNEEARAYVEALIEQAGGREAYAKKRAQYRELSSRMAREAESLRQNYPDKFVAMAPGDVLVVGDSLDEVIRGLRENGVPRGKAIIEFLDTGSEPLVV